jgi:hypothetical protein
MEERKNRKEKHNGKKWSEDASYVESKQRVLFCES